MDNLIEEQPVLEKKSSKKNLLVLGVIIPLILLLDHFWRKPTVFGMKGAIVCWISLGIFGILLIRYLIRLDARIQATAEEEDKRDTQARLNNRKVATVIEKIKRMDLPQWSDIFSVARFHVLPNGTLDITAFPQILDKIHLAPLQQLIKPNEKDAGKIYWNGGELHLALILLEEVARYFISTEGKKQKELQDLVDQLQAFLKYCKPYAEFDTISKEVKAHCPTLYSMIS